MSAPPRPAPRQHVLALDLGTTGVRALVVAADGAVRGRAWQSLATRFPAPGWVEQDAGEWWRASCAVLAAALADARLLAAEVAALGVVSQRSTALAWDAASGAPLAPAIGWQDVRTGPRVAELIGDGFPVNTMASATKFEWLMSHEPSLREAARRGRLRLGTPDAWLTDRLCAGAGFVTDPGQASCTALFDLARGDWHEGALARFGLEREWLPRLEATSAVVGETPRTLLGAAVPVAARAGDQQAATFAQGALLPGAGKLTLGTSAMLDVHTGAAPAGPAAAPAGSYPLALWRLAAGERAYCVEGTVVTAGAVLGWLVRLGLAESEAAVDALAGSVATADGVVFVPSLQGLGTPFLDGDARGAWLGLTRGSGVAHLARAALEGIAQRCADVCEALPLAPGPLRVDGGLARSRQLASLLADLTGREVWRAAETETTALGAAYLAGLAAGVWRSPAEACAQAAAPAHVEPRLAASEREAARAAWRRAVERVRSRPPGRPGGTPDC